MSEELNQLISFWGGVASIFALFASLIGGIIVIIKKTRLRNENETEKLKQLKDKFSSRAKAATTQGKRMDLFIYHQTLFSSLQTSQLSGDMQRLGYLVFSMFIFFFMASLDGNADYLIDKIPGSNGFVYNYYLTVFIFMTSLLFYMNFVLIKLARIHKKRISVMIDGLMDELQNTIDI